MDSVSQCCSYRHSCLCCGCHGHPRAADTHRSPVHSPQDSHPPLLLLSLAAHMDSACEESEGGKEGEGGWQGRPRDGIKGRDCELVTSAPRAGGVGLCRKEEPRGVEMHCDLRGRGAREA
jgi:hypothetical protein